LISLNDFLPAEKPRPGGHSFILPACHSHPKELRLRHASRQRVPKIRPQLTPRRIRSVAAIAIRIEQLIAVKHILRDLAVLPGSKEGEVQLHRPASLGWVRVSLRTTGRPGARRVALGKYPSHHQPPFLVR